MKFLPKFPRVFGVCGYIPFMQYDLREERFKEVFSRVFRCVQLFDRLFSSRKAQCTRFWVSGFSCGYVLTSILVVGSWQFILIYIRHPYRLLLVCFCRFAHTHHCFVLFFICLFFSCRHGQGELFSLRNINVFNFGFLYYRVNSLLTTTLLITVLFLSLYFFVLIFLLSDLLP